MQSRFAKLPEERRAVVLGAITEEIAARGLDGASVSGIAKRAGASKASLFYYFEDRDAMLAAGATALLEEVLGLGSGGERPRFPPDPAGFWAMFEEVYRSLAGRVAQDPARARFGRVWIDALARGAVPDKLRPLVDRVKAELLAFVDAGLACGALRSDIPRALLERSMFAIAVSADGWMVDAVLAGEPPDRAADAVLALVRSAVGARPPDRKGSPGAGARRSAGR